MLRLPCPRASTLTLPPNPRPPAGSKASYSAELAGLRARFDLTPEQTATLVHPIGSLAPIGSLLAQALILGPTLSSIAGLGEEAGWRGLLHTASASGGSLGSSARTPMNVYGRCRAC